MQKFILALALTLFAGNALALSPLEEGVDGKMLPTLNVDPKVAPYYEKLNTDQRLCSGKHPGTIRIIRAGDMITQDYSAERLNIELDSNDTITRAYCG